MSSDRVKIGLIVKGYAVRGHWEKIEEEGVCINHQGAVVRAG